MVKSAFQVQKFRLSDNPRCEYVGAVGVDDTLPELAAEGSGTSLLRQGAKT